MPWSMKKPWPDGRARVDLDAGQITHDLRQPAPGQPEPAPPQAMSDAMPPKRMQARDRAGSPPTHCAQPGRVRAPSEHHNAASERIPASDPSAQVIFADRFVLVVIHSNPFNRARPANNGGRQITLAIIRDDHHDQLARHSPAARPPARPPRLPPRRRCRPATLPVSPSGGQSPWHPHPSPA